ncbi:MAG: hypothetical protein ACRDIY_18030 [Chloroflexota bacterium]
MSLDALFVVRLAHVIAGVSWLGEVITINFVLLPALFGARDDDRQVLLSTVFPHVFRLATVLGGTAVASGFVLLLWFTSFHPLAALHSHWGWYIVVGGTIGAAVYAFHLFQESGAERSIAARLTFVVDADDPRETRRMLKHLARFPRVGMAVLVVVVALMVCAAHFA